MLEVFFKLPPLNLSFAEDLHFPDMLPPNGSYAIQVKYGNFGLLICSIFMYLEVLLHAKKLGFNFVSFLLSPSKVGGFTLLNSPYGRSL